MENDNRDRWGRIRPFEWEDSHGWADMLFIKSECDKAGIEIKKADDDNYIEGYVHWMCTKNGEKFELKANSWSAESFDTFMGWCKRKGEYVGKHED